MPQGSTKAFAVMLLIVVILLNGVCHLELGLFRAVVAADSFPVHNATTGLNYSSIQDAVDASETINGHTILVDSGTYSEHLVVGKSLAIIGSGRDKTIIDGGGGGTLVHIAANNVSLRGFEVKRGVLGIFVDHSDNCVLSDNRVTGVVDSYAVYVSYSHNCMIAQNIVGPNSASGLLVTNSVGFTISQNHVVNNGGYGLNANASTNGIISWNDAVANYFDGIGLGRGCSNCSVFGNNVTGNSVWGVWLDSDSFGNLIYDNDIVENGMNGIQVSVNLANSWDNGVEGNYWSSYSCPDLDRNGIFDVPLVISDVNVDNHPLAGEFRSFETTYGYRVNVASNSTIEDFGFFEPNGTIRFTAQSSMISEDSGFCRVSIPHVLIVEPYNVTIDGKSPSYANYSLYDDGYSRWIYFDFKNLQREVSIQGADRTIPTVSVILPQSKTYDTNNIPLVFVANEFATLMEYSIDGQNNVTIDGNVTIEGVSNGNHSITVYSRDFAGNIGASNTVYFAVNITGIPFVYWVIPVVVVVAVVLFLYLIRSRKSGKSSKPGR